MTESAKSLYFLYLLFFLAIQLPSCSCQCPDSECWTLFKMFLLSVCLVRECLCEYVCRDGGCGGMFTTSVIA